jgi:hypothetical protein
MYNTDTIKGQKQSIQYYLPVKLLLSCLLLGCFHLAYAKVKTPSRSQFTNPPSLANDDLHKNCHTAIFTIKEGINCFNNKQFNVAKTIFQRVKKTATADKKRSIFFTSEMYLTFIAIEQNKRNFAIKKINHLYALRPNFTLQDVGIDSKKYAALFKKVKQHRRFVSKKEINNAGKNINREIECSLKGNCDHKTTCIIEGGCNSNNDIECSISGTCDNKN